MVEISIMRGSVLRNNINAKSRFAVVEYLGVLLQHDVIIADISDSRQSLEN